MNPIEIVKELYLNDGLRDVNFLKNILHDNIKLEWHSSTGLLIKDKTSILNLATELKLNYATFNTEILNLVAENNTVSIAFNYFGSSIENEKELILLGRFITIWEFENNKIIKGYQISQPS